MEDAVQQHKDQQDKNELLTWACARGLLADAEAQVSGGADPHAVDKAGRRPLHYAAAHGHLKVVEFLITRGADLEADDPSGRTALHYAALGRHLAVVSLLCERGCWVDAPDATDCTALHLAARGLPPGPDDRAAARKAAGAGAARSPWASLGGGSGREGPWHSASGPLVRVLAAAGAALNSRNACGLSPAGEAVVAGNVHALAVLVDLGALLTPTYRGYTLLHLAAALGHSQCLERLLAAGRRPDLQEADNPEGLTPLHAAALGGAGGCVALLLDKGADASVRCAAGRLPEECLPPSPPTPTPSSAASRPQLGSRPDQGQGAGSSLRARLAAARAAAQAKHAKEGREAPSASSTPPAAPPQQQQQQGSKASSPLEAFQALSLEDQGRRVEAWSRLPLAELRDAGWPPPGALPALQALRRAAGLLACWEAVAAVRGDAQFQEDLGEPEVAAALAALQAQGADTAKYLNDRQVQRVLLKLNKLHAVLRAEGQGHKVSLEQLRVSGSGPCSLQETRRQLQVLRGKAAAARAAAIAAVLGKEEQEQQEGKGEGGEAIQQGGGSGSVPAPEAGQGGAAAVAGVAPGGVDSDGSGGGSGPAAAAAAAAAAGPWWQGALRLLAWHLARASFMACLMLSVMWAMGLMPDQISARLEEQARAQAARLAAAQASGAEQLVGGLPPPGEQQCSAAGGCPPHLDLEL